MKYLSCFLAICTICISATAQRVPVRFSDVYSPDVPASVTICSETIPLDRSDMYEAFDRELSSIVYTQWHLLVLPLHML